MHNCVPDYLLFVIIFKDNSNAFNSFNCKILINVIAMFICKFATKYEINSLKLNKYTKCERAHLFELPTLKCDSDYYHFTMALYSYAKKNSHQYNGQNNNKIKGSNFMLKFKGEPNQIAFYCHLQSLLCVYFIPRISFYFNRHRFYTTSNDSDKRVISRMVVNTFTHYTSWPDFRFFDNGCINEHWTLINTVFSISFVLFVHFSNNYCYSMCCK